MRRTMRLKTLPLTLWLLLLAARMSYAQTPPELPDGQSGAYAVERAQSYPGTVVLELMEAAEAEIDTAAREAFAEGYKAAMVAYAPDAAAYKKAADNLRADLAAERTKSGRVWPIAGACAAAAFMLGWLLPSPVGR